MSTPNILLTRIDNRLVHGQVGVTWTSTIGANLLIVVDDEVAKDDIQQKLMGITAETYGFGIRFFSVEKTTAIIAKAAPHQKIFLICRTPETVKKLIEGGVPLKDVNVGNMHFSEGKKQISSKVWLCFSMVFRSRRIRNKAMPPPTTRNTRCLVR